MAYGGPIDWRQFRNSALRRRGLYAEYEKARDNLLNEKLSDGRRKWHWKVIEQRLERGWPDDKGDAKYPALAQAFPAIRKEYDDELRALGVDAKVDVVNGVPADKAIPPPKRGYKKRGYKVSAGKAESLGWSEQVWRDITPADVVWAAAAFSMNVTKDDAPSPLAWLIYNEYKEHPKDLLESTLMAKAMSKNEQSESMKKFLDDGSDLRLAIVEQLESMAVAAKKEAAA